MNHQGQTYTQAILPIICVKQDLLCFFASNAIADYASHQFHYMEMELSKCKSIASDAAIKNGFSNPQSQDVAFAGGSYAIVFSTNKEGYSFQYT